MKWKIRKFIEEFRNIKNITFEFIRGGTTIIIGENNVGKSNLLDYFYSENKDWDEFEVSDESYEEEESSEGLARSYRKFSNFFNLFFPNPNHPSPYLFHSSNPRLAKKTKEGQITLSYKIYYFDLTASTSFLTEWGKKELKLKKAKFRSHQVLYGRWDEGKISMINYVRDYFVIESKEKPKEEFKSHLVKEKINNKILSFSLNESGDKEFGKSMSYRSEDKFYLDLNQKTWYVFNDCFGTSEEKYFVKYINRMYEKLQKKYDWFYLIRNERFFKLYNFDDGKPFEPDYLLTLYQKEKQLYYQVFIEPKGSYLQEKDAWKENFLLSLKKECQVEKLWEDKEYRIWGLPFYNKNEENDFNNKFEKELL